MAVFVFSFPAVSMISCPHPPHPPSLSGEGESQKFISPGASPRHPCIESPTALADAAVQEPGGGLPGRSPARPALSFICCPIPRPLPGGKGHFICRGFAPCIPAPEPKAARAAPALQVPGGGLPGRSAADLAFSFISFPIPRPLPPPGKGESQSLFRRGPRHPCTESPTTLANAAVQVPGDGLPGRSAADLAFGFISFPHPPPPSPPGKGSLKVYFADGGPRHPALNRLRHLQTLPYRCPAMACPAGRRVALP